MLEQGPYIIKYEVRKNNDTDEIDILQLLLMIN